MLDNIFAPITELGQCGDEFFGVKLRLRFYFKRLDNRVAQMLQQRAHTSDDYFWWIIFDSPQNFEAPTHGFAIWADAFKRQGLPCGKQGNISLGQESN